MHGTLSKIGHMLGHETNLKKYRKVEMILYIPCDHSVMSLQISIKDRNHTIIQ